MSVGCGGVVQRYETVSKLAVNITLHNVYYIQMTVELCAD